MTYLKAALIGGVVVPVALHLVGGGRMPWWPDTLSLGLGFGVVAMSMVWRVRKDREMNRRIWNALKSLARR